MQMTSNFLQIICGAVEHKTTRTVTAACFRILWTLVIVRCLVCQYQLWKPMLALKHHLLLTVIKVDQGLKGYPCHTLAGNLLS